MGKDKRNGKQGGRGNAGNRHDQDLTYRPMAQQLQGVSVNPECLACGKPINQVRLQRQGWVHDACEKKVLATPERLLQIALEQGHASMTEVA